VKAMLRNNSQSQAVNLIRAQIAAARTIAIAQHRQAGVIFFEEGSKYAPTPNPSQTAMQLIVESTDQSAVNQTSHPENTVFVYYSRERSYLPSGIQVATINDVSSKQLLTGDNTGGRSRVILFDANGQLLLRNGIMRSAVGSAPGANSDPYPYAYGDWFKDNSATATNSPNDTASLGVSAPGVVVFSMTDYKAYVTQASPGDSAKSNWIQNNADILVVNGYTGNIIR
jgi:hypothetical protein